MSIQNNWDNPTFITIQFLFKMFSRQISKGIVSIFTSYQNDFNLIENGYGECVKETTI